MPSSSSSAASENVWDNVPLTPGAPLAVAPTALTAGGAVAGEDFDFTWVPPVPVSFGTRLWTMTKENPVVPIG